MAIKTDKDLLKFIRSLDNVQLNKHYRREYLKRLKEDIRVSKQRNKFGVRGYTKARIQRLESKLKNFDKRYPFIKKIDVDTEIE